MRVTPSTVDPDGWPTMGRAAQMRRPTVQSAGCGYQRRSRTPDAAGEQADQPDERDDGRDDEEPMDDEACAEGDDCEDRE